mgnify:CR=1 FL=1
MSETLNSPKLSLSNNKSIIDSEGLSEYVIGLYRNGISAVQISKKLKEEKGVTISNVSVGNWLKNCKTAVQEEQVKDVQKVQQFTKMCYNYEKEVKEILDEVKSMKNIAKDEKDTDNYQKLVGRLYQGLELLAKLMGDLKPSGSVDINVIINEINNDKFDKFKANRTKLFENIVDVEIIEEDAKREKELKGD